jgi:hypothetical protein
MLSLGLPFRRRNAEEPTREQKAQSGERIETIGFCVQLLRLMLGFAFDA